MSDESLKTYVPVPEGAFPNAVVEIVQYFDAEGEMKYSVRLAGNPPLSTAVGLMELAKDSVMRTYRAAEEEE